MEMLVVIGMIAIVTAVALPKIKDIYEEFRINQTAEETATLISSYRSYYLIMNEFPADTSLDNLGNTKADWCLPRNFYTASPHKFSIKPYKGSRYDFEQWTAIDSNRRTYDAVCMDVCYVVADSKICEKYMTKFSNLYPKRSVLKLFSEHVGIAFPEITNECCESEAAVHRNRYH